MQVGPDAPEIMQGLAVALKAGATKAVRRRRDGGREVHDRREGRPSP